MWTPSGGYMRRETIPMFPVAFGWSGGTSVKGVFALAGAGPARGIRFMDNDYEGTTRIVYGDEGATFVPVCIKCSRFVKADQTMQFNGLDELKDGPNATCKKCGRTEMLFEGYY